MRALLLRTLDGTAVARLARRGAVQNAVQRLSLQFGPQGYLALREQFIDNGRSDRWGRSARREIVQRFEHIHRSVDIASSRTDGLFLAEAVLSTSAVGDLIECGCYRGGSTAKLSVLASVTGRKLRVFDSFEGLPEVDDENKNDHHSRHGASWTTPWTAGRYAARLELVEDNVRRYGEIGVSSFVKGFFETTLKPENLPHKIAVAFADVDIPSSARECLLALWPRLDAGGVYFTHDVAYLKVIQALTDHDLWARIFREPVPPLFGAGFGLGDGSPHLGYFVKGPVTAAYLKSLTLAKE